MMSRSSRSRALTIVLAVASATATAGYFTGTWQAPEHRGFSALLARNTSLGRVPRQAEVESARHAQRRAELAANVARMGEVPRSVDGTLTLSPEEQATMDAAARTRRAWAGAPPVVPHAVDPRGVPACLVCHERGMRIGSRIAAAMRHEVRPSCLQCHAPPAGLAASPARATGPLGWHGGSP